MLLFILDFIYIKIYLKYYNFMLKMNYKSFMDYDLNQNIKIYLNK